MKGWLKGKSVGNRSFPCTGGLGGEEVRGTSVQTKGDRGKQAEPRSVLDKGGIWIWGLCLLMRRCGKSHRGRRF